MVLVTNPTSVARFTGFESVFLANPSTEMLGYFPTSALRTKPEMLDHNDGYTNKNRR